MKGNGKEAEATLGFIGTGVMGRSMALHLLNAGHDLVITTRTRSKALEVEKAGARFVGTAAEVARSAEVVMTMVGFPEDVEEVYFGKEGLFSALCHGHLLVDLTTSRPDLAMRIAEKAAEQGAAALDAPVSGGDAGARAGTLSIMVGGSEQAFQRALPFLQCFSTTLLRQGSAGRGQYCKMSNQIAIAAGMVAVCESLAYAEKAGLDPKTVLKSISGGAAGSWSLSHLAPRMLEGDFAPGFYVKHFRKDLRIALESAQQMDLELPGLQLASRMYERLEKEGHGDEGTQALWRLFMPS